MDAFDDNNALVTITFDPSRKTFTYGSKGGGHGAQQGRKVKVKKGNGLKWESDVPWGIRFDPTFRPDDPSPLGSESYSGAGGAAGGGNVRGDAKGRYKYWVAVYAADNQIYMDDPDVVVEG